MTAVGVKTLSLNVFDTFWTQKDHHSSGRLLKYAMEAYVNDFKINIVVLIEHLHIKANSHRTDKLVCWNWLDQCYPFWRWLEFIFTRLNMLIVIGSFIFSPVSESWCSVNMTIIFHTILNPTAILFVGVCLCGVN